MSYYPPMIISRCIVIKKDGSRCARWKIRQGLCHVHLAVKKRQNGLREID